MRRISILNVVLLTVALLGMFSMGLGFTQYLSQSKPHETQRLVCFSFDGQLRLNIVENNIRFDEEMVAFSNSKGDYRIYVPKGYLCSIVNEGQP